MTFGEKLYHLRKTHGLSQEALAEKLNTSRQAISKWENNNGYPETEKIIFIGKLFQASLDDLLIEEKEIDAPNGKRPNAETPNTEKQGYYVSRETANGFLLYYKRKFLLLAAAAGCLLGCNGASYGSTEPNFYEAAVEPILATVSVMMMLAVVIYIILKQNPYRTLRKKELILAEDVRKEIEEEFAKMKKILIIGIALCLFLFAVSEAGFDFDLAKKGWESLSYTEIIRDNAIHMILVGVCCFVTVFCTGIYWSYTVLLRGGENR